MAEDRTLILDSLSVNSPEGGEARGGDGGKKIHGRKRHIAVDSLGQVRFASALDRRLGRHIAPTKEHLTRARLPRSAPSRSPLSARLITKSSTLRPSNAYLDRRGVREQFRIGSTPSSRSAAEGGIQPGPGPGTVQEDIRQCEPS